MQHPILSLILALMWLFVAFCLLVTVGPPTHFQRWLTRPGRAFFLAWRLSVPYRYAFIVLFIVDKQWHGELTDEKRERLAHFVRQHYPELYTYSVEVFQPGFLRGK